METVLNYTSAQFQKKLFVEQQNWVRQAEKLAASSVWHINHYNTKAKEHRPSSCSPWICHLIRWHFRSLRFHCVKSHLEARTRMSISTSKRSSFDHFYMDRFVHHSRFQFRLQSNTSAKTFFKEWSSITRSFSKVQSESYNVFIHFAGRVVPFLKRVL